MRTVQRSALCRSRRELSNPYLIAKCGFDTAENEPSKGHNVTIFNCFNMESTEKILIKMLRIRCRKTVFKKSQEYKLGMGVKIESKTGAGRPRPFPPWQAFPRSRRGRGVRSACRRAGPSPGLQKLGARAGERRGGVGWGP